ncbi:class I SAM-dependent methyltransferase [Priestia aryabhattai]|uniref:Class I SAM-dependent methyltransferase n=1 Tax=Priestia aryabhattai TaxID=412384 RepID=A0AAX6NER7_PRIAR|nr:class I SAM-dependent methyltransferase [Priestia aryabhattai]MDU9693994.1 class I SAM-dependent methyltransferase [Priestia aryabhattai]
MIKQRKYWDEVANNKNFTTPFRHDLFSKYVNQNAVILDYGCGYGRSLVELKNMGYKNLHGVDFSKEMIKRAILNSEEINYQVVTSGKLPYPTNYFDSVLLFAVLTCLHSDEEQNKILNELKRVLKPNGIIYVNDFLLNDDERNKNRYEKFYSKYNTYGVFELPDGAILRHHNTERTYEWGNDFEQLEYQTVEYVTMNNNRSNGLVYMGKLRK